MTTTSQQSNTSTIVPAPSPSDKNETNAAAPPTRGKPLPKPPDEFYKELYQFHERRGTPITHTPKITGRPVDLHRLYSEVTERGGFLKVNVRDEWEEIAPILGFREKCLNATAAIKQIYRRFLDKYERMTFFGEDPDKIEALEASDALETGRSGRSRYPSLHTGSNASSIVSSVPMSYNYRQHIVNNERRRLNKMSTDFYKATPYEKLMLSLLSPLPNEQDFAINVCTLMSNENKHTLKLNECPKLLDILLAHAGIFADYTLRKLFQHVYVDVRENSLYGFWRDLLHDKPQILDLYTDEGVLREAALVDADIDVESLKANISPQLDAYLADDFFNLKRGEGTQDYVGQRVQQVAVILRNLSFFDENMNVFAKNRSFLRFIVMAANVRWGNVHIQALDMAGNIATEFELLDPTTDDLSRSLMATLCDGIEGMDRAVILNCLEILYKICQKDSNEDHVNKCLNLKFYETICLFLSLNDIMLLIYTLEAIYALTSMGARPCQLIMQVRGLIDQLVALITVEAQSYGPDGCILMRVVETVPGNMLPMVAQNIANLQTVASVKQQIQNLPQQNSLPVLTPSLTLQQPVATEVLQQQQSNITAAAIGEPNQPTPTTTEPVKIAPTTTPTTLPTQPTLPTLPTLTTQQQQPTQPTQLATPTQPATPTQQQQTLQMPQNYTHEDEQYALAWLGATFERSTIAESRVEQQELYRMYLAHCQKSGKHSVVNHLQFPRLVRLIYNQSVGPLVVRGSDGTDLPGFHYVGIRVRAQPLPIQGKPTTPTNSPMAKTETGTPLRRIKKKLKPNPIPQSEQSNETTSSSNDGCTKPTTTTTEEASRINETVEQPTSVIITTVAASSEGNSEESATDGAQNITTTTPSQQQQPSTSLIKSLLHTKVTQRQQKQKDLIANPNGVGQQQQSQHPIKVASTAISALVNNPLMQNTPVKVGQTTIKPLSLAHHVEKKPIIDSTPPPLAPLSGNNIPKDSNGRPIIIATTSNAPMLVEIIDNKKQSSTAHALDPSHIPATIIKRKLDDSTQSPPPLTTKRIALDETPVTPSKSAANLYAEIAASILEDEDMDEIAPPPTTQATVAPTAINSQSQQQHQQQQLVRIQQPTVSVATIQQPMTLTNTLPRQLIFHQSSQPQLKSTLTTQPQQIPTAMATIKTDQGLQTVPVILQQKPMDGQHLMQSPHMMQQQTTTQYVLATNPQGQTYLVAQQTPTATPSPPPTPQPTQTVLVTQTPQQQSAGTKTIIILQQPIQGGTSGGGATTQQLLSGGSQKVLMTTSQGQQVLVTRPATTATAGNQQQQIFINPQTGTATQIHHYPTVTTTITNPAAFQRQIIQTAASQSQQHHHQQQQSNTGQISPTLLSQLNHIPATIKLHQPQPPQQPPQPQPATISRIGKPIPILPSPGIPQLQQHQSIIQQHIVSGPSDKRQVILGGGRAIEIKETIVTHSQLAAHQSQLNSQTIITTQQPQQSAKMGATPAHKVNESPALVTTSTVIKSPAIMQNVDNNTVSRQLVTATQRQLPMKQQTKIQSTNQPVTIAPKPGLTGGGPPPLAAVSNISATSTQINKPHPEAATEQSKPNPPTSATSSMSTVITNTESKSIIHQQSLATTSTTSTSTVIATAMGQKPSLPQPPLPHPSLPTVVIPPIDPNWLYICDWRNCPRRRYKSLLDLQYHVTSVHCPDHLDPSAEIFCQWGAGPHLCDGVPRKRFSLMTHLVDRHLLTENLRSACQRRIANGTANVHPTQPPVTIVRNVEKSKNGGSPTPATSSNNTMGFSALHAIKRHTADFMNAKELMDENEGPVTKSIRLTAALILRNLVTYTNTAKRSLRRYEPHLANIALSNVESSGALSHILAELNN